MKRTTIDFRTEFTVGGASTVIGAARNTAAALGSVGDAAKKAAAGTTWISDSTRAAVAGVAAVSGAMQRMMAEMRGTTAAATSAVRSAATGQVDAAETMARGVGSAVDRTKASYEEVGKAAKAAVRAAEEAGRLRIRRLESDLSGDEEQGEDRVHAAKRRLAEAEAARKAIVKPKATASRSEQDRHAAETEAADFLVRTYEDALRTAERGLARLRKESKQLVEDAARDEAEKLHTVRAAEDAKVAAAKRTLDEARRAEAEKTLAVKREAAARAKAAEDEAKARARSAEREYVRNVKEVERISKAASAAFLRLQAKRQVGPDVEAGLRDPDKARATALAAAEKYHEQLAKLTKASQDGQERIAAAPDDKKVAASVNRSLGQFKRYADEAEANARHTADVVAEVEKRLKEAAAAAEKAGKAIDAAMADARKAMASVAAQRSYARDLARGLMNPRQAIAMADAYARAHERALARVVAAAHEARLAIAMADATTLAQVTASESAKVEKARDTAQRMADLAKRTGDIAREVGRRQERAAQDAAKANERAAQRTEKAWKDSLDRISRVRRALPSLLGHRPGMAWQRLHTDGGLSLAVGLARRTLGIARSAFSVVGTAGRVAFGAISSVTGLLGSLVGTAGRAAGGILGLGVSAATAAGRMALNLGTSAVALLGRLGAAAVSTAARVAGIARTVVIRAAVVGAGAAVAGFGLAKKATGDAAAASKEAFDGSLNSGTGLQSFQTLQGAAKRAGVDMAQFNEAITAARGKMADLAEDPALLQYFSKLGVGTRDYYGRLRDTTSVLADLLPRVRQLNFGESQDLLTRLFGSPEAVERIRPLLVGIADANNSLLAAGATRQAQLGSLVTYEDVARQRAYAAATYDLHDAWTGVKLAVSRAVGNDVIRGMVRFADNLAANRGAVAGLATKLFSLGDGLWQIVRYGRDVRDMMNMNTVGAGFARALFGITFEARQFGIEVYRAFGAAREAERIGSTVWVRARKGIIDTVHSLFVLKRSLAGTLPFFRDAWNALRGNDGKVNDYLWMSQVTRFARDMWRTVRGRDEAVTAGHEWMISIRDDLFAVGRFAREVWRTVRGDTAGVTEFPILLRVRSGLQATFAWAKAFAVEAWTALTGGEGSATDRFPWMQRAREEVVAFVGSVKEQWNDLVSVWNGGSAETALGRALGTAVQDVQWARKEIGLAWDDMKKIFAGDIGEGAQFNFPWLRTLAEDADALGTRLTKAWEIFKAVFTGIDNTIKRFTFGKLDLATVAMVSGFATLFGVTRVVIGGIELLSRAAFGLRNAWNAAKVAAVGAGAAGSLGAAGGLAGAMTATGTAVEQAASKASNARSKWGKLGDVIGNVGRMIAQHPGIAALLGIGAGVAGEVLSEKSTSLGGQVAGGALQGAGMGAGLGSFGGWRGAGIGAVLGGAYGAYAAWRGYDHEKAIDAELEKQGRKDLADARRRARDLKAREAAAGSDAGSSDGDPASYDPAPFEIGSPGSQITGPSADEQALAAARRESQAGLAQLAEEMRRTLGTAAAGVRAGVADFRYDGAPMSSPFVGNGMSATDFRRAGILGDVTERLRPGPEALTDGTLRYRPQEADRLSSLRDRLVPLRDQVMANPMMAAAVGAVEEARRNILDRKIPSPAEFARDLMGGMPGAAMYAQTGHDLYAASTYAQSPLAAPPPVIPPVAPQSDAGGDSFTVNVGDEVLKIRGRFSDQSKADVRAALARIAGMPGSGSTL